MIIRGALNHATFVLIAFTATQLAGTPHSHAQELSSVPFVGCASDGQVGPRKAPHGKSKSMPLSPALANQLAYYQAEEGSGVLAPREWHCFSTYGSSAAHCLLHPK